MSGFGYNGARFERTLLIPSILEVILFLVADSEDVVSNSLEGENSQRAVLAQKGGVEGQVSSLQAVGEGYPYQVTEGEHEAEAIRGDVHGCQHGSLHSTEILDINSWSTRERTYLVVESIEDVDTMHQKDEPHTGSNLVQPAESNGLLAEAADIENPPQDHSRSKFVERFDVKVGSAGRSRVQRSSHPELNEPN